MMRSGWASPTFTAVSEGVTHRGKKIPEFFQRSLQGRRIYMGLQDSLSPDWPLILENHKEQDLIINLC